eukprot:8919630-Pyramimonas_sp.AAC.1
MEYSQPLSCVYWSQAFGVKADIVAYNTLLDACRHAGDIERAFGFWEEMKHVGLEPSAISYGTIMSLCG